MKRSRKNNEASEPSVIRQFHWPDPASATAPSASAKQSGATRKGGERRPWTKEDDAVIKRHYTKRGSRYTAELLERTVTSVQHRALKLGIPGHGIRPWTAKEKHYLRKYYGKLTAIEIARILRRSEQSVRGHIHQMGLGSYRPSAWSAAEETYLRKHYGRVKVAVLAAELERSTDAVELKAGKLGLRRKLVRLNQKQVQWIVQNLGQVSYENMARHLGVSSTTIMKIAGRNGYRPRPNIRAWTCEEDEYLRKHYGVKTRREIAEAIGRTVPLVGWRAAKLGLTRGQRSPDRARSWSREEDATLRAMVDRHTYEQIANRLKRTRAAVVGRAVRLGLTGRGDAES